jgi:hypothetical protein
MEIRDINWGKDGRLFASTLVPDQYHLFIVPTLVAPTMSEYNPQNLFTEEPIINMTISESRSFPILEIQIVSPSLSLYSVSDASLSGSTSLSDIFEDDLSTPTRLTAELLSDSTEAATFDVNGWGWNSGTVTNNMQMNFITPRQRTFSLCTDPGHPTPLSMMHDVPVAVPEVLPSLSGSTHAGDDEDDYTEAESIIVTNQALAYEPQIRTTNSIPSIAADGIITPELGFNAPEAFADFEDLPIIVAALRLDADERVRPVTPRFEVFRDEI